MLRDCSKLDAVLINRLGTLILGCFLLLGRFSLLLRFLLWSVRNFLLRRWRASPCWLHILCHLIDSEAYSRHLISWHLEEVEHGRVLVLGSEVAQEVVKNVGVAVEGEELRGFCRVVHLR